MARLYLVCLCVELCYMSVNSDSDKRLLLDTDSPATQQQQMLHDLQQLTAQYAQLQNRFSEQSVVVDQLSTEIGKQKVTISHLQSQMSSGGEGGCCSGEVYTRWGRSICPNNTLTDTVYTGYAGGSSHVHTGGTTNRLCMPKDPQQTLATKAPLYAFVYGTEYHDNFFSNVYAEDAPCAVCRPTGRPSVLMLPGRVDCYSGWTKEYDGVLSAGAVNHVSSSQYICLDINPEAVPHGHGIQYGSLLYPVGSACGSLPCPPYTDNATLTCVVCSK